MVASEHPHGHGHPEHPGHHGHDEPGIETQGHHHEMEPPCDDHTLLHGPDTTTAALRVVWRSAGILAIGAAAEIAVSVFTHSAGVLADGLHNAGDVFTAFALALAFRMSRRQPDERYPYGLHRSEDLASLGVLLLVALSAVIAGYTSFLRLLHPVGVEDVWIALATAVVGFGANELAAGYKFRAAKKMKSVALEMDAKHSRLDGIASIGAAVGVLGTLVHFPLLDPIAGLAITALIVIVAWEATQQIGGRLLDKADPDLVTLIEEITLEVPGVEGVRYVRARWIGRRILTEMSLDLKGDISLKEAHAIGEDVRYHLHHAIDPLAEVSLHFDPCDDPSAHEPPLHHRGGAYPHDDKREKVEAVVVQSHHAHDVTPHGHTHGHVHGHAHTHDDA